MMLSQDVTYSSVLMHKDIGHNISKHLQFLMIVATILPKDKNNFYAYQIFIVS